MRILHFSDFHLEKECVEQSTYMMDRMMEKVIPMHSEKKFDLIIFTGDMIDRGGSSFDSMEEAFLTFHKVVVERLCNELCLDESQFIAVPGNHEVNRNSIDRKEDHALEAKLVDGNQILMHLIGKNNKGFDERLKEYDQFYRTPWLADTKPKYPMHSTVKLADHMVVEIDNRKIGISLLNSAWRCGIKFVEVTANSDDTQNEESSPEKKLEDSNEENRVLIGASQINDAISFFKNNGVDLMIALAHHHYSLLGIPDDSLTQTALKKNYDIGFFGHTHKSQAHEHGDHDGRIISAIAPGTWHINESADSTFTNGFSVWDIDFQKGIATESQWKQITPPDFSIDKNIGNNGFYDWHLDTKASKLIVSFDEVIRDYNGADDYDLTSPELEKVKDELIGNPEDAKILYGVSGVGKTHLLRKSLGGAGLYRTILYCSKGEKIISELETELKSVFQRYRDDQCCLILDNASLKAFEDMKELRDQMNSSVHLIGVINSNLEPGESDYIGTPIIELKLEYLTKSVNDFIDKQINNLHLRETIKRFADGFPKIAFTLIKLVKSDRSFTLNTVHTAFSKLYQNFFKDIASHDDVRKVLEAMALFQPFPKLPDDSMGLWKSKHLSSLHKKEKNEIVKLIDRALASWNGELIENKLSGYNIRPYSLAIRLAEQWFKHHTAKDVEGLLEDISLLPPDQQRTAISCLKQRLAGMHKCKAAEDLLNQLTEDNGVFRSENVVLSDLGSQLILAASNVNPAAIANSIRFIIDSKTPEEIKSISYFARRNIVFALTKLIYYPESFHDAMTSLALLAVNETENMLSNNSQGVFEQVFHVLLSGTSVNLKDRIEWLSDTCRNQKTAKLLPKATKGAMAWGHFMRTGGIGAEYDDCKDYQPTNDEIKEYWRECTQLALNDIASNGNVEVYSEIIANNIHLWVDSNVTDWVFPFIKGVVTNEKSTFHLLEYDFNDIVGSIKKFNPNLSAELQNLKDYVVSEDFLSKLKSRQQEYYMDSKFDEPDKEIEFFRPMAQDFIANRIYENKEDINQLLKSIDFHSWAFCAAISENALDTDLSDIYSRILESSELHDDLVSPFLMTLCSMTRNRECTKEFIQDIFKTGYYGLYTRLMARTEDETLSNLGILEYQFKGEEGSFDFIPLYLSHVSLTLNSQDLLLHYLDRNFNKDKDEIMHFLITHYCFAPLYDEQAVILKSIIYRYSLHEELGVRIDDLVRLVMNVLKYQRDDDFASFISEFFLDIPHQLYDDHAFTELYGFLINEYQDLLLDNLIEKMSSDSRDFILYRLSESLGSGYGFGAGPLFTLDEDILIDSLKRHGINAARMFAKNCPVFDTAIGFSKWVVFLLDNYGDDAEVRDNISCNMSSFSWTGSLIPLLDKKIKCFEKIANHPNPDVREWVAVHLKGLKNEKLQEETQEDFLNQLYR